MTDDLKLRPRQETNEDKIESKHWRVLAFTKSGQSHTGTVIFNSETEAKTSLEKDEVTLKNNPHIIAISLEGQFAGDEYSYGFPIPAK